MKKTTKHHKRATTHKKTQRKTRKHIPIPITPVDNHVRDHRTELIICGLRLLKLAEMGLKFQAENMTAEDSLGRPYQCAIRLNLEARGIFKSGGIDLEKVILEVW
jgi:hypothetical protein